MLKTIWSKCWEDIKARAKATWVSYKELATSSFTVFKDVLMAFVTGVYNWIIALGKGLYQTVTIITNTILVDIGTALLATLKLGYDWVIAQIKKW